MKAYCRSFRDEEMASQHRRSLFQSWEGRSFFSNAPVEADAKNLLCDDDLNEKASFNHDHSGPLEGASGEYLIPCTDCDTLEPSKARRYTPIAFALILFLYIYSPGFTLKALFPACRLAAPSLGRPGYPDRLGSFTPPKHLLEVFQVSQPVFTPSSNDSHVFTNASDCVYTTILMDHVFAWSYEKPFVGRYTPPPCSFNRVTFNFTVTSRGRQFDRLGLMYLGDTEVFRTSTAEPNRNGIKWTYVKDMSHYLSLFKTEQKVIFDLGNLINDVYTGTFNATLTATFFTSETETAPADLILPISAKRSSWNSPSAFSIPSQNASVTYDFPRNVRRAVVTLSACGQADEEFWFGNVLSSDVDTFPSMGHLFGYSPFREVQLYLDGELAGVGSPFPIIFTGGVVPGLWRPVVGIDAFDLREQEIDITPWLPILCDGATEGHSFEIRVVGIDDDGRGGGKLSATVANYWVVTGKIFLWLDEPGSVTTGNKVHVIRNDLDVSFFSYVGRNTTGGNETLSYAVYVDRALELWCGFQTSTGWEFVVWVQVISYSNRGLLSSHGYVQATEQVTRGYDRSDRYDLSYSKAYQYPISFDQTFGYDPSSGNFSIKATIDRGLHLETRNSPVFPTGLETYRGLPTDIPKDAVANLHTAQNGSAFYYGAPAFKTAYGYGTTEQTFLYSTGPDEVLTENNQEKYKVYKRYVLAANDTVLEDEEKLVGKTFRHTRVHPAPLTALPQSEVYTFDTIQGAIRRGPKAKKKHFPYVGQI